MSKSHKKILKRVNKFLRDGQEPNPIERSKEENEDSGANECFQSAPQEPKSIELNGISTDGLYGSSTVAAEVMEEKPLVGEISGPDLSKAPCKKAKQMRIERKMQKMANKGETMEVDCARSKNKEKSLEDFLNEQPQDGAHKLQVWLIVSLDSKRKLMLTQILILKQNFYTIEKNLKRFVLRCHN